MQPQQVDDAALADDQQRRALAALRLNWVVRPQHVWGPPNDYVPELHRGVSEAILAGVGDAKRTTDESPLGLVVEGTAGTGKTHLLSWVREQVQADGGYFFLVCLTHGETFWETMVEAVLDGLWRIDPATRMTQLQTLLTRLDAQAGASGRGFRAAIRGRSITPRQVDMFTERLAMTVRLRPEVVETARALTLYAFLDPKAQDIAKTYFLSADDIEHGKREEWGLYVKQSPAKIVQHVFQLIALTGHSVVAMDQIDTVFARAGAARGETAPEDQAKRLHSSINQIADGLMALQENSSRTLSLVVGLPTSWQLIRDGAVTSVADRFRITTLEWIRSPEVAQAIVQRHLATGFRSIDFDPPHATWPVSPSAFAGAAGRTPRKLLQAIDAHAQACLASRSIREMTTFDDIGSGPGPKPIPSGDLARLDQRFQGLRSSTKVDTALDAGQEDLVMPVLLSAGIAAWITEHGSSNKTYVPDPPPSSKPLLHAGLRRILNPETEEQEHYAFRAIGAQHHRAELNRLRSAITMSGLAAGDPTHRLVILRQEGWSRGKVSQQVVAKFQALGGIQISPKPGELRVLDALGVMLKEQDPALESWLRSRRPASRLTFLGTVLPTVEGATPSQVRASDDTAPIPVAAQVSVPATDAPGITLGRAADDSPVRLPLESLRKHVAIFAGSGSGKTVLLRRLIEECALQGVSAIVLDPNNDLARLGDPWPEPPAGWLPEDAARAAEYLENTEVVVWTPRRESGRPLTFQPLPDFSSVIEDRDEFVLALDVAVSALVPRAKATAKTHKAELQRAVLRESLEQFAKDGGGSLDAFIEYLADLPSHVSTIGSAADLAELMAETLKAAKVNDPLFGGGGTPIDPALLLQPSPGRRARVSVISFIGLPSDDQRQSFISQLQMALFAWFKQHPAGDRPLGGLLVMDEAQTVAPSGAMTPSTESTLVLASQARKYGLGLVFATQAPRGLHNRIPGNATTQFFGLLNSPTQIEAARGLARDKGGSIQDIGKLTAGEFYLAGEGTGFVRTKTFLCLSHHPRSPLTADEVLERALKTPESKAK